jgi:hypothetical protein
MKVTKSRTNYVKDVEKIYLTKSSSVTPKLGVKPGHSKWALGFE